MTQFTAVVEARKNGGVAITLPFDPNTEWGQKDRHDITGTVAGRKVRGKLKGQVLELGPAWWRDNPLGPGTTVKVDLKPEGPQLDTIGDDMAHALTAEPEAKRFFAALPTFYRKNFMRWIDSAKRPETRATRIAETIATLKAGKRER